MKNEQQPVRLLAIFLVFLKLGACSFGGGMTGWVYREVVQQRRWIAETDFLSGLAISQIVPGANVANLTIYVGQRLRGTIGALVAFSALLLVPFFVAIGIYVAYTTIAGLELVSVSTDGVAAAAIGLLPTRARLELRVPPLPLVDRLAVVPAAKLLVGTLGWATGASPFRDAALERVAA
jgi:chromate transporter